jgi:chemotaxis response regulator CheB
MTFFIAGIGGAAGGLDAVTELLGALPATTDMAIVVVQHPDPTLENLLSGILAKKTAIPAAEARAGEAVQPGHVYVNPADSTLTVRDGHIDLKPRTAADRRPAPVDMLFTSLAVTYADRAIGVVLSGDDSDGALGVREIRSAGGVTFAQLPASARFPNMPQHAIETGCVDFVLRPGEIAGDLVRLSRRERSPAAPVEVRSRRVLIVDDHEEFGNTIARLVRTWGHEVEIARNALSALALAESFRPECAIVDISLPETNGLDLARRLREMASRTPLYMIALTGYAGEDIRAACLTAGFDTQLVKPPKLVVLEKLLRGETETMPPRIPGTDRLRTR